MVLPPHLEKLCADSKCYTPGNSKVEELETKNKKLAEELEIYFEAHESRSGEMSKVFQECNEHKYKLWDLQDQSRRQNETISQLAELAGMSGVPKSKLAIPYSSKDSLTSVCSFCYEVTEEGKGRIICECKFRSYCSAECKRLHWIKRHKKECHLFPGHYDPFSTMFDAEKFGVQQMDSQNLPITHVNAAVHGSRRSADLPPHRKKLCAESKCYTPGNSKVEELEMKNKKLAEELEMHWKAFERRGGEINELLDDFNDLKYKMWDLEEQSRLQNKTISQLAQLKGMSGIPRSNLAIPFFSEITETSVCSFCYEVTEEGKGRVVCECGFRCYCSPECKRLHWIRRHKNECHLVPFFYDPFSKRYDPKKFGERSNNAFENRDDFNNERENHLTESGEETMSHDKTSNNLSVWLLAVDAEVLSVSDGRKKI